MGQIPGHPKRHLHHDGQFRRRKNAGDRQAENEAKSLLSDLQDQIKPYAKPIADARDLISKGRFGEGQDRFECDTSFRGSGRGIASAIPCGHLCRHRRHLPVFDAQRRDQTERDGP